METIYRDAKVEVTAHYSHKDVLVRGTLLSRVPLGRHGSHTRFEVTVKPAQAVAASTVMTDLLVQLCRIRDEGWKTNQRSIEDIFSIHRRIVVELTYPDTQKTHKFNQNIRSLAQLRKHLNRMKKIAPASAAAEAFIDGKAQFLIAARENAQQTALPARLYQEMESGEHESPDEAMSALYRQLAVHVD